MTFPAFPDLASQKDNDNKFLIQDPFGLRKSIIPLLHHDIKTETTKGWGTGFRIDPFGTIITAHHVVEDFIVTDGEDNAGKLQCRLKDDAGLFDLEGAGLILGKPGIPMEYYSYIEEAFTVVRLPQDKFIDPPPQSLSLADLLRAFPDDWQEQRRHFGF